MVGQRVDLMVGVVEGFRQQASHVVVGGGVVGEGSFTSHPDQPGQAELGEVLGDSRGRGAHEVGETGDRRLALQERPQDLDARGIGQQPETLARQVHLPVGRHLEALHIFVHT